VSLADVRYFWTVAVFSKAIELIPRRFGGTLIHCFRLQSCNVAER
jgi:hypothetical protein